MATETKEYPPPPSYEEAMKCSTFAPLPTAPTLATIQSQINQSAGLENINVAGAGNPQNLATTYGSFESQPVSVEVVPSVVPQMAPQIMLVDACPACRVGTLEEGYSCLGLFCAIAFFPIGILCCLAMKTKRCSNCDTEI